MYKILGIVFLCICLISCNQEKIITDTDLIENNQYVTIGVDDSNRINDFEKEDLNIQDELFQGICGNGYKYWKNKNYGYEICIPNNWNAISAYSGQNEKFHDYIEEIGILYNNQLKDSILLSSSDRSNIFDFGSYGITNTEVSEIINDKVYIDGYKRNDNNELKYQGSFLILKSGDEISNFYYDINNKEHVYIIESIKKID